MTNTLNSKINISTVNFLLLTIATAGIYPILWVFRNTSIIESETKTIIYGKTFLFFIVVCYGWSQMFNLWGKELYSSYDHNMIILSDVSSVISILLIMAYSTLLIVWAFKAREQLKNRYLKDFGVDLNINAFATFFFNVYYINYAINGIPKQLEIKQIIEQHSGVKKAEPEVVDLNAIDLEKKE